MIWNYPHVIKTAKLMTDVGRTLSIPTIATEQYPKAMGPTVSLARGRWVHSFLLFSQHQVAENEIPGRDMQVPEIPLEVDGYRIKAYEKKLFSMVTEEVGGGPVEWSVCLRGTHSRVVCIQC